MTKKPNILFIMADQLRADYLGCNGHASIKTPVIDGLAASGVNFSRAYTNAPVCGAARMSFYTGRYVASHGASYNNVPLKISEKTIGDYLRPLGYRIFCIMLIANVINFCVGQFGLRLWARIIKAPESFIYSSSVILCFMGIGLTTGGLFGVGVMLAFALLGYLMTAFGYSTVVFIITFFLGARFESSLGQTLILLDGDVSNIMDYPIAIFFLVLAVVSTWWLSSKSKHNETT